MNKNKTTTYSDFIRHGGDSGSIIDLEGAKILEIGNTDKFTMDGINGPYNGHMEGGLTFIVEKDSKKYKYILGYTELGLWLQHKEEL